MTTPLTSQPRVVILGGGYAGLTAATRLGTLNRGVSITLIDAKFAFLERIRLHQVAAGQSLKVYRYRDFLQSRGVEFMHGHVIDLDPNAATLTIRHTNGELAAVPYDYLVYALGSSIDVGAVHGAREFAQVFNSLDSATRIHARLAKQPDARVLVVGGGLTGIETAAELVESFPDLRVTLAAEKPFGSAAVPGGYCEKAVNYLNHSFERLHIAVKTGGRVTQVREQVAAMSDGTEAPFDTCIWTSGFVPSPLAGASGIQVNPQGQIVTDRHLRSLSHPNIIAIGDAAQAGASESGPCRMGSATGLAMATAGARTLTALLRGKAPPQFRFVYLFRNICLGRHDGLIQFVDRRDMPRNLVWTGALAARWKEYVCQSTLSTIGFIAPEKLPVVPPLRMLPQLLRAPGQYA